MKVEQLLEAPRYAGPADGTYEFGLTNAGNISKVKKALKAAKKHFYLADGFGHMYFIFDTRQEVRDAIKIAQSVIDFSKEDSGEWKKPRGVKEELVAEAKKKFKKGDKVTVIDNQVSGQGDEFVGKTGVITSDKMNYGCWTVKLKGVPKVPGLDGDMDFHPSEIALTSDLKEAHFDDPEFDMQTHDDDEEIMSWCKKNAVNVEKKGAKNLVRFSGTREALRNMIHQFWGQPADYTSAIREGAMKNLLTDFEEYYLDNDGSTWSDGKLATEVSTFLKKKGLPVDLQVSLVKAAKTFGSK